MIFNSSEFFLFLPVVFVVYWVLNRWTSSSQGLRLQNLFLLGASYLFYGWWEWRFLGLIALSTAVDYVVGLRIAAANERELGADAPSNQRSRGGKAWLWVSVGVNLGLLIYFKYANFFIDS